MQCPACQFDNPSGSARCRNCNAALDSNATILHTPAGTGQSRAAAQPTAVFDHTLAMAPPDMALATGTLSPGMALGARYEIVRMLGEGGMGAVYEARDREVDRVVALKVIRPEYANRPEILSRFKQELVLAREITHRNVIRIFDLGQADGIRFITMEFIRGQDLHSLLTDGHPIAIEEKVRIMRDVCRALEAAHAAGVVHRDLKPHNIMIEKGGRAVVMDFGIARSMQDTGLTSTGALIGTPAYMSPEQAKGEKIDTRSDLFSLGVIFYELLTGTEPYQSETTVGLLLKRVQERPIPPIDVNKELPQALSDVVLKCLVVERDSRYQTATEVIRDLEAWMDEPATFRPAAITPPPQNQQTLGKTIDGQTLVSRTLLDGTTVYQLVGDPAAVPPAIGKTGVASVANVPKFGIGKKIGLSMAAVAIVAGAVFGVSRYMKKPAGPVAPMTVMIADFNNHTGDAVFSGTLESTLKLALEGASFINAYNRTRMPDLGLKPISGPLDDSKAQEIATSQGLNVVVSGSIDRRGADYQLTVRAIQTLTGKSIANAEETAASKDQVLFAVTKLGTTVRKALGDATSESAQRFSMETLTAASLEAVHEYAIALDDLSSGRIEDALKHFSQAVDLDSNFGLAYLGMAAASHNLSRQQDADKYIKLAVSHIDHMTERERYRTRGYLYYLDDDNQKCVDEYGTLLVRYPSDTGAYNNIADCLTRLRNIPKAIEEVRRAVTILPKRATYHVNVALYSAYAGDFPTASKEAAATLQLAPAFAFGFEAQAFASLGQGELDRSAEAYQKIAKIRPSMAAAGLADLDIYSGRYSEAVKILEKGAADDIAAHNPDAAADKFSALAYAQVQRGQKGAALAALKSALDLSKAVKTRFLAARQYVVLGEAAKAHELAAGLSSELQIEPQAYGKLIEGEIVMKSGDGRAAVKSFTEASAILDTWIGRFDLGTAYLEVGAFTEADSEFDRCLKRRGEAMALFLDEVPTYGYFPPVYYYQGRVREGLKSSGFAESYKKYLDIRGQAGEDPLLADVRRRIH
jgi:eukaryotic-like serine/threonine-protein kinase